MNQHKLMQALALLDQLAAQETTQQAAVEELCRQLNLTHMQACIVVQTWLRIPAPEHQGKPSDS